MDSHFLQYHGCTIPFQTNRPDQKQCHLTKTMEKEYWNFLKNTVFKVHCQTPCELMDVTFPPLNYVKGSSNEAFVQLVLSDVIKVQTSFWSYPIISLLAEVGGYVGLLLGISLLDITKIIDRLFQVYFR